MVNSFSKYYCMTGWRIGWHDPADQVLDPAVERLQQNLSISVRDAEPGCGRGRRFRPARSDLEVIKGVYAGPIGRCCSQRLIRDAALVRLSPDRSGPSTPMWTWARRKPTTRSRVRAARHAGRDRSSAATILGVDWSTATRGHGHRCASPSTGSTCRIRSPSAPIRPSSEPGCSRSSRSAPCSG